MRMSVGELLRGLDLVSSEEMPQVVRLDSETIERIGEAVSRRPVELAPESIERIAVELAHMVAPATAEAVVRAMRERAPGEAIRGEPALREEKPPFGTEEYKRYQAMKMTARLTRMFADLPPEEQDFVWAMVEERKRLREREEYIEPSSREQPE